MFLVLREFQVTFPSGGGPAEFLCSQLADGLLFLCHIRGLANESACVTCFRVKRKLRRTGL